MALVPEEAHAALLGPLADYISADVLPTDNVDAFRLGHLRYKQAFTMRSARGSEGERPPYERILDHLCTTGSAHLVRFLLDERLCTPSSSMLERAASGGRVAVIRAIVDSGVSVDYDAPLACAAQKGHVNVMEVLLDAGASPAKTVDRRPPLHIASASGSVAAVRLLLARGADVNSTTAWGGVSALWCAADTGAESAIAELLAAGASMQPDKSGLTPLMMAAMRGAVGAVQVLVSNGANVAARSKAGHTVISLAAQNPNTAVLRHLLDCCPSISLSMLTDALWSAVSAESPQALALLVARGANARSMQNGQSLIAKAAQQGRLPVVDALLAAGADPHTVAAAELRGEHATLPRSYEQFAKLTSLALACLPDGAYNMPLLTSLSVLGPGYGRLAVHNLGVISHLTSLRTLRMWHCNIHSPPRYVFCNMQSLSTLDFHSSQLDWLPLPPSAPQAKPCTLDFTTALALRGFVPHQWRRSWPKWEHFCATSQSHATEQRVQVLSLKELAAAALPRDLLWNVPLFLPAELQEFLKFERTDCAHCSAAVFGRHETLELIYCSPRCRRGHQVKVEAAQRRRGRIDLRRPKQPRTQPPPDTESDSEDSDTE